MNQTQAQHPFVGEETNTHWLAIFFMLAAIALAVWLIVELRRARTCTPGDFKIVDGEAYVCVAPNIWRSK